MTEKEEFIELLKAWTKKFAVDIIAFSNTLKKCKALSVSTYQIVIGHFNRSELSRSLRSTIKTRVFSKICIVVEEADESQYWLEIIKEADLSKDKVELLRLTEESTEITKIMSKAKNSTYGYKKTR